MIEFELDDWSIVKNIFININEIIFELMVQCDSEGLHFNALDKSHVCFFKGDISKDLFDKYEIDGIFPLFIGLDELVKVLKRGNGKDSLIFKADNGQMEIIFKNKNKRKFTVTELDMEDNSRVPPNLNYSVNFDCEFDFLKNALKDAELYSDRLTFTCEDDLLVLSCEGMSGNYINEYFLSDSVESCSATYSIDWLFKIINMKLGSNILNINMGDDFPMLIGINSDFVNLNYILAPRLENGE